LLHNAQIHYSGLDNLQAFHPRTITFGQS